MVRSAMPPGEVRGAPPAERPERAARVAIVIITLSPARREDG